MADKAVTENECVELLNRYLTFDGDEFRWTGTHNQLKRYFDEDLKLSGNWTSPSGGVWLFSTDEFQVKWQKSMKLVIVRDNSGKFMLNCLMKSRMVNNSRSNQPISPVVVLNDVYADVTSATGDNNVNEVNNYSNAFEMSVNNKLENILKVLSEFKYIDANLQEENTTMKRSFEDLTHRHENLMSVSSDLNQRVKDLETNLLTAIKLIYCERSNSENCVTAGPPENLSSKSTADASASTCICDAQIQVIDLEKSGESEKVKPKLNEGNPNAKRGRNIKGRKNPSTNVNQQSENSHGNCPDNQGRN
ncbi:Hypothetical predicted protein [Paramuricea clavata]|uniref:Uncharacterized protein n=1 Tax=Paramuricea clavata TaxID=317549 RepID=A0A7D9E2V3_PARCT|nr:Hypothetical predicted protein [Paramuricea clavata]